MVSLLLWLFSCATFSHASAFPASVSQGELSDSPTAANFLRRAYHGSAVLGDFVFIDGGEFSQLIDGAPDPGQGSVPLVNGPYSRQNNVTLSIDLEKSWSNSSLVIRTVPQGSAPVLSFGEYWKHPDGKSFYLWNGEVSALIQAYSSIADSLWKFSSDGMGNGTWSSEPIDYTARSSATSQTLLRPGGAGCSTTIGDTGYYVGGRVWAQSDVASSTTGYFQNTITSFNMSSGVWRNDPTASIGSVGSIIGASAETITALGLDGRGLMALIGGRDPGTNVTAEPANYYDLSNVTIYDPYIDVWYAQTASGDIPSPREAFCAVTIPGDNRSYEIFIYGGLYQSLPVVEAYADVYVLSIPGFVWHRLSDLGAVAPRFLHTCELVGRRQFLTIGGLDNPSTSVNIRYDFTRPDPFTQGIGIFDMTAAVWKSSYDAGAPAYQSPQVVKDWYAAGNQASVQWQSLELARMFILNTSVSVSPTPAATASGTAATASTAATGSTAQSNSGIDTKIALGVGIPSLMAALASVWWAWKMYRLKTAKAHSVPSPDATEISEQPALSTAQPHTATLEETGTNIPRLLSREDLEIGHP